MAARMSKVANNKAEMKNAYPASAGTARMAARMPKVATT